MAKITFTLQIQVKAPNNILLSNLKVEAWYHYKRQPDELLGEAQTNEEGQCQIEVERDNNLDFLSRQQRVYFKVFLKEELIYNSLDKEPLWPLWEKESEIILEMGEPENEQEGSRMVSGYLVEADGQPVTNALVFAYHKDVCNEVQLGKAYTNAAGFFQIKYEPVQHQQIVNLILRAKKSRGKETIAQSRMILNAKKEETVNLVVGGGKYIPPSKFYVLSSQLDKSLQSCKDLNALSSQDIILLGQNEPENFRAVENYIKSQILESAAGLNEMVLFALLEQVPVSINDGLPDNGIATNSGSSGPDEVRYPFKQDILQKQLGNLFQRQKTVLVDAINRAANENQIPLSIKASADDLIAEFRIKSLEYLTANQLEDTAPSLKMMTLANLKLAEMQRFQEELDKVDLPTPEFWQDLIKEKILHPNKVQELLLVADLRGLTDNDWDLTAKVKEDDRITTGRDLAQFNQGDWKAFLREMETTTEKSSARESISIESDKVLELKAKALATAVEKRYPTSFFAHRMEEAPAFESRNFDTFFKNNPTFEFRETNLQYYLNTSSNPYQGIHEEDKEVFTQELKASERLFKITPDEDRFPAFQALWDNNLHSSQAIVATGRTNFISTYKGQLGQGVATSIYNRAEHVAAMSTNLMATFGSDFQGVLPAVIKGVDFSEITEGADHLLKSLEEAGIDQANLKTLFGNQDFCSCKHCRSVYSAAAYLTDLLSWLNGKKQEASSRTLKDALFTMVQDDGTEIDRRKEIGHILLNCENTNTPLPYIDLVIEILENAVTPHSEFLTYQTTLSPEELKALPEHTNPDAYTPLKDAKYPFTKLPFEFHLEEARLYLNHLGVPLYQLMQDLPSQSTITKTDISAEYLGLSRTEWTILVYPGPVINHFGVSDVDELKIIQGDFSNRYGVKKLMDYTYLSFEELTTYFQSLFVNPDRKPILFPTASCALDTAYIELDINELQKLHLFARLQKKIGWPAIALDKAFTAFGVTDQISEDFIAELAQTRQLVERLNIGTVELLCLWSDIDTNYYEGEKPLYDQVFLNRTVNNPIYDHFEVSALGNTSPFLDDEDIKQFVLGAIQMKLEDYEILLESDEFADYNRSLSNLTRLYALRSLLKALGISASEYLLIKKVTGLPPFDNPGTALAFLDAIELVYQSGFTFDELSVILRNEDPAGDILPDEKTIQDTLAALSNSLKEKSPESTDREDTIGNYLNFFNDAIDLEEALKLINGTSTLTEIEQEDFFDYNFGFLTIAYRTNLKNNLVNSSSNTYLEDLEARRNTILNVLRSLFAESTTYEEMKSQVIDQLSVTFGIEPGIFVKIKDAYVNEFSFENELSSVIDNLPSPWAYFIYLTPGFISAKIEEAEDFSSEYRDHIMLYHQFVKIGLLFTNLGVREKELNVLYYRPINNWLNLKRLDQFPVGNTFTQWKRMAKTFALRKFTISDEFSFPVFIYNVVLGYELNDGIVDLQSISNSLSENTPWDTTDIKYLLNETTSMTNWSAVNWNSEKWVLQLAPALSILTKLQASAEQAIDWSTISTVSTEDSSDFASQIRNAAKAKHSNTEWLNIAPPLRDVLRKKQRDALSTYLIATRDEYQDAFDLYEFYLVDTEMDPCAITTRILLAISSIQLLVQRILMNLEPGLRLTRACTDEWEWRKNYRVWEANRKVFLYPENWIEPELRDDKTIFFQELEDEILQDEITEQSATRIFNNYLEKLEEVAFLEIAGMYQEKDEETATNVLHVFARTKSNPHKYFYRKWMDESYWTGWEKVEVDIEGEHLTPVVYNNQLVIFWLQVIEKAEQDQNLTPSSKPETYNEIKLYSSIFKNNKWTPKRLSKASVTTLDLEDIDNIIGIKLNIDTSQYFIHPEIMTSGLVINIWTDFTEGHRLDKMLNIQFVFNNILNNPRVSKEYKSFGLLRFPHLIGADYYNEKYYNHGRSVIIYAAPYWGGNNGYIMLFRNSIGEATLKYPHQNKSFIPKEPFFYEDEKSCFFITIKETILEYADWNPYLHDFTFFFHPYIGEIRKLLNLRGISGLLKPNTEGSEIEQALAYQFIEKPDYLEENYLPVPRYCVLPLPKSEIDFSSLGGYSIYNWELFFQAPLMIACHLSKNQKFEEAQKWFHYIFDPTEAEGMVPARFWKIKPFHTYEGSTSIEQLAYLLNQGNEEAENQVALWEKEPFKPHVIARIRIVAYMKAVVMKYLDNLIAWGDQLFRRDTMESTNEATLIYSLAAQILGRKPERIQRNDVTDRTYNELESSLDAFSNALVALENSSLINPGNGTASGSNGVQTVPGVKSFYFCIPENDKLLAYWDTVADRLFKIRHCLNIEGVERQLALFAPPIDPALLVKAAAGGLDIGAAIGNLFAPLPYYRFQYVIQKAFELVNEVKSLGNLLLSVLEKKDAEELALLRANQEAGLYTSILQMKKQSIEEAKKNIESLELTKEVTKGRFDYYGTRIYMNAKEIQQLKKMERAIVLQTIGQGIEILAGSLALLPDTDVGISGAMGSPVVTLKIGGINFSTAVQVASRVLSLLSSIESHGASKASILGGYDRRRDDWQFQTDQASRELKQIDKQIEGAKIRQAMAEGDLETTELQIQNAKEVATFMQDKYTNKELYGWMSTQISSLYFQMYNMAYDLAKQAEKTYQHELFKDDTFIEFGHWDSLKKGLLAGERLYKDLKRLELAHMENNRREYELTKHVSLALIHPTALIQLQETGVCDFDIPEIIYDLDHPGHYLRRIKSVSITIPCITGPYTSVGAKLSLVRNRLRKEIVGTTGDNYGYTGIEDTRFRHNLVGIQSIATSSSQNDSGVFQLDFRDERYLPFEGAGAVSSWHLELPEKNRQFDYDTITDVIIHINYTARDGGALAKTAAEAYISNHLDVIMSNVLEENPLLIRAFSMKQELSENLYQLLDTGLTNFNLGKKHFPYLFRSKDIEITDLIMILKLKDGITELSIDKTKIKIDVAGSIKDHYFAEVLPEGDNDLILGPTPIFSSNPNYGDLPTQRFFGGDPWPTLSEISIQGMSDLIKWTLEFPSNDDGSLPLSTDKVEDVILVFEYKVVV